MKYGFLDTQKVQPVIIDFLESSEQDLQMTRTGIKEDSSQGVSAGEIRMCVCSSCNAAGAGKVFGEFQRQVEAAGMSIQVKTVGCMGISYQAPLVEIVLPDKSVFRYGRVRQQDVRFILARHLKPAGIKRRIGAAATRMLAKLLTDDVWEPVTRFSVDLRHGTESLFWGHQEHVVTEHCGSLNPLDIVGYIAHEGFRALKSCLTRASPDEIINQVSRSGLRGRGGAGFPTGKKWAAVRDATTDQKYVICNGDEGDPGAFMDRMILESFPFRVIEGMAIAAYAVGAGKGFLYIRAEYPLAIFRVKEALRLCHERNIIGDRMIGTKHSLHLEVVEGAGAFVAGEETALIAAIEGRRAMPRFRPPYPNENGLWNQPTLVNNVETFAAVPWILRHGPEQFARIGTQDSRGTKTFALAGKVVRGGLIEVPMGITLREIVDEIGGGVQDGKRLKAIQVGGPSGGCVPAELTDTPVDYDALVTTGAIMGSGGMVVLDETDCMVDIARYFMTFTQNESCGKCTYCRIGTKCMLEILERLVRGEGKLGDIEELEHLARITKAGSLCGLGKTAPNPVISTLQHFRSEYEAHIDKRCPAARCKALITYSITDDCIGCTRCAQQCPAEAIQPNPYEKHEIDPEKCVRCGTCRQVCRADAIKVE
ncbi:Ion-translocating oxidoreductase complex subunit C [subsurface metagenome]